MTHVHRGIAIAKEEISGKVFHEPSAVPYRLVFISNDQYETFLRFESGNEEWEFVERIHRLFGRLVGFSCAEDIFVVPEAYARAAGFVDDDRYVEQK